MEKDLTFQKLYFKNIIEITEQPETYLGYTKSIGYSLPEPYGRINLVENETSGKIAALIQTEEDGLIAVAGLANVENAGGFLLLLSRTPKKTSLNEMRQFCSPAMKKH